MFFIFIFATVQGYGEQTWQGNAAMIRRGEFDTTGFFAASNSFPLNTKILVKNLHNMRTTEVIVVKRLSEYYSVFLLLSEEAAHELGMSEDTVINVEVTVVNFGTGDAIGLPDDLPYNPDPDVFPLPTVPDDTARITQEPPTPLPEDTPVPTEEITPTPAPGETPVPTPEPSETPGPEPTVEPTMEPAVTVEPTVEPAVTVEPTVEPASEPTPLPLDSKLDRDPQKNLFLPPHEDEMYVLEDYVTPEYTKDEKTIPDPEVVNADEFEGKAIDGSITAPEHKDKDTEIASLEMKDPDVEDPSIDDKTRPEVIASGVNLDDPAVPAIVEKPKPVPDPSNEVPAIAATEIALEPQEPVVPGERIPDPSNEVPEPWESPEYDIAMDSAEPGIPEKDNVPDPSTDVPEAAEYDIALEPGEPDLPDIKKDMPDPSYELPDTGDTAAITMEPAEPDPPTEAENGKPDPSYEVPESGEITEIALEPAEPDPPTEAEKGKPDPSYEVPESGEITEIALEPAEPDPPTEAEKGKPDPSYEVPDSEEIIEIALEPTEPQPPTEAEKGKPDPSYDVPHAEDEKDITLNPADPDLPKENGKEPDTNHDVVTPEYDEEVIITFEETGPKPPTGDDMIHETNGKKDTYMEDLEKGKYFIQLAAYTEKSPAVALEKQYSAVYPVKVYAITDKMLEIYKVMIGPLNKYESDTLLYRFKALGFRDAFVKYIN